MRIYQADVAEITPGMYAQLRELNYRGYGSMQWRLQQARKGLISGVVTAWMDGGKVISYCLLHDYPHRGNDYQRVHLWMVQGWTRKAYRGQGLATELRKIVGVRGFGQQQRTFPDPRRM